jgi:PilZ domain
MTVSASNKIARVLIVCGDFEASRQITDTLAGHALLVERCVDPSLALERLSRRKYEAVIVDLSFEGRAVQLLQQIRNTQSNRTAVTFAVTSDAENTAFALKQGFGFVLERPLTAESIAHTLKVAYGLIVRERRRYFRYSIVVPAVLTIKGMPVQYARTINVSEGGMAVCAPIRLVPGSETAVEFTLTDPKLRLSCDARVCWYREHGEAGLSFLFLPSDMVSGLQQWLSVKLERELPTIVTEKFR